MSPPDEAQVVKRQPRAPVVHSRSGETGCVRIGSMPVRYPAPLRSGDRVGVTSPSSGVNESHRARLDVAVADVEARGYDVVVGRCMDGAGHVSAPAADRAEELMSMILDPGIKAVVPPWGGDTAIDLLPLL